MLPPRASVPSQGLGWRVGSRWCPYPEGEVGGGYRGARTKGGVKALGHNGPEG